MLTPEDLYDYQRECITHQLSHHDSMLWLQMGLGKTPVTLTAIVDRMKLQQVQKVLIFGPLRVIQSVWEREARKWTHTKHLRFSVVHGTKVKRLRALFTDADIYLINYEGMNWLAQTLLHYYLSQDKPLPFNMVVYDECFTAGTPIDTPRGDKPIEKIQIGDSIHTHHGMKSVTNVMKSWTSELLSVKLSNGNQLNVTLNHPFLVDDVWVSACELKKGDILHGRTQDTSIWSDRVPDLPEHFLEAKVDGKVMFKELCQHMENATTAYNKSSEREVWSKVERIRQDPRCMEQRCTSFRKVSSQDVRISEEELQGDSMFNGWKWNWRFTLRKIVTHCTSRKVYKRMHSFIKTATRWIPDTLQNRFWRPEADDRNRSSGTITLNGIRANSRQEETTEVGGVRVESVVYQKQRRKTPVWNLSVSESETYFAGGVLVHNCSKLKNSTSLRMTGGTRDRIDRSGREYKIAITGWRKIIPHFKYRTGLTGTPASNGYIDLHGQYLAVDGGKRLGEYITHYKNNFFMSDYMGWSYTPTVVGTTAIEQKISDITIKMDTRDYLDLPKSKVTDMMVDLPDKARKAYQDVERDLFTQLDNGTEIELFSRNSISNKTLQFCNGSPYVVAGSLEYESLHDVKLDALEDILEEAAGSPVLCSYTFKSDAERIMKRFKKIKPVNMTATPSKDTGKVIDRWISGKIKLMIGHPLSMSHGIDGLQDSGSILVWFGLPWSLESYLQMNGRLDRQGQKKSVSIIRILCRDTIDLAVADALENKSDNQEGLKAALDRYRYGGVSFL